MPDRIALITDQPRTLSADLECVNFQDFDYKDVSNQLKRFDLLIIENLWAFPIDLTIQTLKEKLMIVLMSGDEPLQATIYEPLLSKVLTPFDVVLMNSNLFSIKQLNCSFQISRILPEFSGHLTEAEIRIMVELLNERRSALPLFNSVSTAGLKSAYRSFARCIVNSGLEDSDISYFPDFVNGIMPSGYGSAEWKMGAEAVVHYGPLANEHLSQHLRAGKKVLHIDTAENQLKSLTAYKEASASIQENVSVDFIQNLEFEKQTFTAVSFRLLHQ